jgi:aminoglycoside phosphotransferase (APT) family kinase protein
MFNKIPHLHREYNIPDVLVHGDMLLTNMLFVKDGQRVTDDLAGIIDWQVMHIN